MNKIQVIRKKHIYNINYYEVRLYTLTSEKRHVVTSVLKTCSKSIAFKEFKYINDA